ncbi:helix-turn-helix transcriptional regulator [Mucilaginibacter sp. Bleaf8]|uniref:winged helix-turn-helix transcriptional regulator n=1 Tax=Mucilaginibacter sp. Bleaf8 TaxID=2834430 RepID=UPI001BCC40DE|nr:helix-turn-helix domain-containing protein [Mucilaginibacter sp. Bleaf8]MBS7564751.1 helix-turn-helix transcriptional regulator [Mucilaginibacter sp. Bleaf8]
MQKDKEDRSQDACAHHHLAIRDTMELLSGKWKIRIIGSLSFGPKRFMELKGYIDGIAAKMLSKELQDLETNGLVNRTVLQTKPITVEYKLTPYGYSLQPVIDAISDWGMQHRNKMIAHLKKA